MSAPKDGGGAFPQFSLNPVSDGTTVLASTGGMTLRDWFAGQALAQSVEDYGEPSPSGGTGQRRNRGDAVLPYSTKGTGTREEIIARQAYRYADAMLAAREVKS